MGGFVEQDGLTAVQPGRVTVDCRDGRLSLDVRQPTALVITQGSTRGRGVRYLDAEASDSKGPLSLGSVDVRWTIGSPLREMHPCSHGFCAPSTAVRVMAEEPGTATVSAEAVGLTATTRVEVE